MTELFKNTYRIPSIRASWHDYKEGIYFVTLCTYLHECYFGEIKNAQMNYSLIGKSAYECWKGIPQHFPFVEIPLWVIMPNHIHGIIVINTPVETQNRAIQSFSLSSSKETQNFASLHNNTIQERFGPQSKNLASIIRGFKIGVTQYAHQNSISFAWQSRFYDRIVRNAEELNRIAEYIENNVAQWDLDEYYRNPSM